MSTITSISYGFLSGNILSGAYGRYNEKASAERYADALHNAFRKAYPDADIEIDYQMAEGSLPHGLKPVVTLSDGTRLQSGDRGEIEDVEEIASKIWGEWDTWALGAYNEVCIRPASGGFGEWEVAPDSGEAFTDLGDFLAEMHNNCDQVIDLRSDDAEELLEAAEADVYGDRPKNIIGSIHNEPPYVYAVLNDGVWGYTGVSEA